MKLHGISFGSDAFGFHNYILIIIAVLLFTLNYLNLFKIQLVVVRIATTRTHSIFNEYAIQWWIPYVYLYMVN